VFLALFLVPWAMEVDPDWKFCREKNRKHVGGRRGSRMQCDGTMDRVLILKGWCYL